MPTPGRISGNTRECFVSFCFVIFFFLFKPVKCYFNKEVIEVKEFNEGKEMTEKEDIGLHVFQSVGI